MLANIEFPEKAVKVIFTKSRYKVLHGGRGSGKSWSFARALVLRAVQKRQRILCAREMQNSIKDSVHRLICDQIHSLEADQLFDIQKDTIRCVATGSEFFFKGLRMNVAEIKSMEGIDICWVEEAEQTSEDSWTILIPTIRKDGSEIWISFNPESEDAPTHQRFVVNPPPETQLAEMNFCDNPWFQSELRKEMEYCRRVDFELYEHVWLGKVKKYANAVIFKNKIKIEEFPEPPEGTQFYYGADFGFSVDPTAIVQLFIKDRTLYVLNEFYGHGVEILELPSAFKSVPGTNRWNVMCDSARPDTISYLAGQGFYVTGADKGKGSVEDGIEFLRSFESIVIHPRCKGAAQDFGNYRWKVDRITGEILPIPVDSCNHIPDACRYALEKYIKQTGTIWEFL